MKFIYQNNEYSLNELEKEHETFKKKLKNPTFLISDRFALNFTLDYGYQIASNFFNDLFNQITSAKFALIMGHNKIHDRNYVSWKSGARGQYWLRFQYLKNSIIWYNSSFDIILKTIWFGFALYKKIEINENIITEIDSLETYNKLLKACGYSKVVSVLKQIDTPASKELVSVIKCYCKCFESRKINEWANKLKHHGNFIIQELYSPNGEIRIGKYNSNYTAPEIIEIEELIEILKKHHIKLIKLVKYVFDFFLKKKKLILARDLMCRIIKE